MLPCFQLLRIGGGRGGDLYTFHPPTGAGCTYRLGCRADLCDVALRPQQEPGLISGIHAELHAERRGDDWRVSVEDHSSQGTLVNNVRLPRGHRLELSDGDLLTFGPEGPSGTSPSEFYFMFQQVRVKPQDFAAITIPRSRGEAKAGFLPMLPSQGAPQRPLSTLSPAPKATLILNSIGSLSKLQPQPLTFSRSGGGSQTLPDPTPAREVGTTPAPPPRNRRKSAHRVLAELDDEGEAPGNPQPVLTEPRKKLRVEKTSLTPSGNQSGRPQKHPVSAPMIPPVIGLGNPVQPLVTACPKKRQWPGFSVMVVTSGTTWLVLAAASRLPGRSISDAQGVVLGSKPNAHHQGTRGQNWHLQSRIGHSSVQMDPKKCFPSFLPCTGGNDYKERSIAMDTNSGPEAGSRGQGDRKFPAKVLPLPEVASELEIPIVTSCKTLSWTPGYIIQHTSTAEAMPGKLPVYLEWHHPTL